MFNRKFKLFNLLRVLLQNHDRIDFIDVYYPEKPYSNKIIIKDYKPITIKQYLSNVLKFNFKPAHRNMTTFKHSNSIHKVYDESFNRVIAFYEHKTQPQSCK